MSNPIGMKNISSIVQMLYASCDAPFGQNWNLKQTPSTTAEAQKTAMLTTTPSIHGSVPSEMISQRFTCVLWRIGWTMRKYLPADIRTRLTIDPVSPTEVIISLSKTEQRNDPKVPRN